MSRAPQPQPGFVEASSSLRDPRAFGGDEARREHNDSEPEDARPIGDEQARMRSQTHRLGKGADVGVLHETAPGLAPGQVAESDDLTKGDPPPGDRGEDRY